MNTFLKAIIIVENPKGFHVQEPMTKELQSFFNQIGYNGEFKSMEFKKPDVPGLWTILMHIILPALSEKHGSIHTMSKDWHYVV